MTEGYIFMRFNADVPASNVPAVQVTSELTGRLSHIMFQALLEADSATS